MPLYYLHSYHEGCLEKKSVELTFPYENIHFMSPKTANNKNASCLGNLYISKPCSMFW